MEKNALRRSLGSPGIDKHGRLLRGPAAAAAAADPAGEGAVLPAHEDASAGLRRRRGPRGLRRPAAGVAHVRRAARAAAPVDHGRGAGRRRRRQRARVRGVRARESVRAHGEPRRRLAPGALARPRRVRRARGAAARLRRHRRGRRLHHGARVRRPRRRAPPQPVARGVPPRLAPGRPPADGRRELRGLRARRAAAAPAAAHRRRLRRRPLRPRRRRERVRRAGELRLRRVHRRA